MEDKSKKKENKQLQNFGRWLELGDYPDHFMTPEAGKGKPWYYKVARTVYRLLVGFVMDVVVAIKTIIKGLM